MTSTSNPASTVAYLGPEGTFTHVVALRRFGPDSVYLPQPDLKGVFDSVLEGRAGTGFVPLENSSAGWIYETIDLLIGHASKIQITEEHSLDVELAFAGHAGFPIEKIYSHFAPLKHNAQWLSKNYPQAKLISSPSTAQAANLAKGDPTAAAITSRSGAAIYGLDVLVCPLGAEEDNVTRFIQITAGDGVGTRGRKTGLVLTLKNIPGSLLAFLVPFSDAKLNLSGIVSRPIFGKPNAHRFFIEVDGSDDDSQLKVALATAGAAALSLVSLGNYSATARMKG